MSFLTIRDRFLTQGAIGNYLDNTERRDSYDSYKGFNRKNVSSVIRETDPRK